MLLQKIKKKKMKRIKAYKLSDGTIAETKQEAIEKENIIERKRLKQTFPEYFKGDENCLDVDEEALSMSIGKVVLSFIKFIKD